MSIKKFLKSFLTGAGLLAIIVVGVLLGNFGVVNTAEAASVAVTGYAWSDNIGWIQFDPKTTSSLCTATDCGVNYGESSGQFSGYAWSDNIGWVYFGPDITGKILFSSAPEIPKQWAKADAITPFDVKGWAIAYRAVEPEGQTLGGWDGWMKFDKSGLLQTLNSATINLADGITKGDFNGYVWGGDVVGWVSLNCKEGGVETNGTTIKNICNKNDDGTARVGGVTDYKVHANLTGSALSVSCYATPDPVDVNQQTTFIATASGGTAPYTYTWAGATQKPSPDLNKATATYTTSGTKTVTVNIEDSLGAKTTLINNCSVLVNPYTLTVKGIGKGTVKDEPQSKIDCSIDNTAISGDCEESYVSGTEVVLKAIASAGSTFGGWSGGGCSGVGDCTVTMNDNKDVTATFDITEGPGNDLTVTVKGNGNVKSDSGGINCTTDETGDNLGTCSSSYSSENVTLTAKAPFGWVFTGWTTTLMAVTGNCSGLLKSCYVTMNADKNVTATFSEVKIIEI